MRNALHHLQLPLGSSIDDEPEAEEKNNVTPLKSPMKLGNILPQSSFSASFDPRNITARVQETINYEYEDGTKGPIEKFRVVLKHTLENTFVGYAYNQSMLLLSVLSCIQFIYQTYLVSDTENGRRQLYFLINLELAIACIFLFDWCAQLFIAELRIEYITG